MLTIKEEVEHTTSAQASEYSMQTLKMFVQSFNRLFTEKKYAAKMQLILIAYSDILFFFASQINNQDLSIIFMS